ncbi:MAG: hypothetical protein IKK62_06000 [Bacteroidaceae bacterium]|nr:hypothetical protein [Bacteroidaceae bacterium]
MAKTYIFNPDSDLALANGDANYLPPRSARRMADDLSLLPAWYADEGDAVLIPSSDVIYYWSKTLSNNILRSEIKLVTNKESLPSQPLSPWGWNAALVKQMKVRGLGDEHLPSVEEMEALRALSSRRMAVEVLKALMQNLSDTHRLIGEAAFCVTEEEIVQQVTSYPTTMLKAPWSSSGKGLRRGQGEYAPPLSGWCARTLAQQGAVVVEPLYRKVKDFAMEFYSAGDGAPLTFVGYSRFVTDANGSYEGNLLMADEEIERELSTYVSREALHSVRAMLQELIGERIGADYRGYVGVDMMVCLVKRENQKWDMCLHPCVEINLRMNMGVVAHIFYERYVAKGCRGRFVVDYYPTPEALREAHRQRMEEAPLQLSPEGRICKGYLPLTPVGRETQYLVWALISEE